MSARIRAVAFQIAVVGLLAALASSCGGSNIQGTYTNTTGLVTLELKSGGEASFALMGEKMACTYKQEKAKLLLTCPGQTGTLDITIQEDGSLTPVGGFIGNMKKSKS